MAENSHFATLGKQEETQMGLGEMFGVKQIKLNLKGDYPTMESLYEAIKDLEFEAGKPQLVKQIAYVIAFPQLDRNNQVQILGGKGKYTVTRSVQPAGIGKMIGNMALDEVSNGWSSMSGAFGNTKKRCMELVEKTAETIHKAGI